MIQFHQEQLVELPGNLIPIEIIGVVRQYFFQFKLRVDSHHLEPDLVVPTIESELVKFVIVVREVLWPVADDGQRIVSFGV